METSPFIAKLIAADGFTDQKQFSTRQAAIAWLDGEGLATFEGEAERHMRSEGHRN